MWIQCKSDPRSQFINLPNPKSHQILGLLDLQKNKDGPRKWRLSLPCSNDYMIFWHSWCLLSVPSTSLGANELDKSSKQKILKLKKMSTCNISNIIWNTASQKPKLIYLYLHIYIYTHSLSLSIALSSSYHYYIWRSSETARPTAKSPEGPRPVAYLVQSGRMFILSQQSKTDLWEKIIPILSQDFWQDTW